MARVPGGPSMMKKLLPLALIAVAGEAPAEDAKCVPERAAMIETIRAYSRSGAGLLEPQAHIGEHPGRHGAN